MYKKNILFVLTIFIISIFFIDITFSAPGGNGGRNNGNKINYNVNSSTKTRTVTTNVGCQYQDYDGYNGYSCNYGGWVWGGSDCINCTRTYTETYIEPTYCPSGEELIDIQKNKTGLPRNGTLDCMVKDYEAPDIVVNLNGYINGSWTNKNVRFNVSVSDIGLGLKKSWYIVNGIKYTPTNFGSFELNFIKDGVYNVTIGAEDNSTHFSIDGSSRINNIGNITILNYTVKIDKFPNILTNSPLNNSNWQKTKPILSFKIEDKYEGKSIEIKEFSCGIKPENSIWKHPANLEGKIIGTCNPDIKDCTNNSNYSPNSNNCSWECNIGYSLYNGACYVNSQQLSCTSKESLPSKSYKYNKNDILEEEGNETKSYRKTPTNVSPDGSFISTFNINNGTYSPNINECSFDCKDGYHSENGKCVNNISIVCCKKDFYLSSFGGNGVEVDCNDPINSQHPSCVYNVNCNGYIKDVMKFWDINKWKYSDGNVIKDNLAEACGISIFANSNGTTCNPGYYLTFDINNQPKECVRVPLGEWSGQENEKRPCTNKPSNSTYIAHTDSPLTGGNNDCPWVCNSDYERSGNNCVKQTKVSNCSSKPENTVWNSVSSITQYKEGNNWLPSLTATYNETPSTTECRFKCAKNYTWNGTSCIADTRTHTCTGLPSNATWNTVGSYTQTWNGTSWTPTATTSTYNTTPSTTSCRFKCNDGYSWNGSSCIPN